MNIAQLKEVLDGCEGVVVHEDAGLLSVWTGGATVNVYDAEGACLDCWTRYDMDGHEVRATAIQHIEGGE